MKIKGFVHSGGLATVLGQAVGVFHAQAENNGTFGDFEAGNGKLRDEWRFVLDLHFEAVIGDDGARLIENLQKCPGRKAMIGVILKPGLESADRVGARGATAIDEPLVDLGDLGDVSVGRKFGPGRQDKTNGFSGVFGEGIPQGTQFHKAFFAGSGQQLASWQPRQATMASDAPMNGAVR